MSPSGQLVIDLATLRQVQSATATSTDARETKQVVAADTSSPIRREISRLNIGLSDGGRRRPVYLIAAFVVMIAMLGAVVIGGLWWRGNNFAGVIANPVASPSPTPTPEASPSPSPSPTAKPERRPPRRSQKPSKVKKVWDKVRGIFR